MLKKCILTFIIGYKYVNVTQMKRAWDSYFIEKV